jgi:hypothetical protein
MLPVASILGTCHSDKNMDDVEDGKLIKVDR